MNTFVLHKLQKEKSGYVVLLENSLFSGLFIIEACFETPEAKAEEMSLHKPGKYNVCFYSECDNPLLIKKNVLNHLTDSCYAGHFYQISKSLAIKLIKREINRINIINK